jgi:hypothetical protein
MAHERKLQLDAWCDDREVRIIALGWVVKRTSRSSHQFLNLASVLQIAKFVPSLPQKKTNFTIRTLVQGFNG